MHDPIDLFVKPRFKRVNTLKLSVQNENRPVNQSEIIGFLKKWMKEEDLEGFYFENRSSFFVKFTNTSALVKFSSKSSYDFEYEDGKKTSVLVSIAADYLHTVRVFNVPLDIDNQMIVTSIQQYGAVADVKHELTGDDNFKIRNGNRTLTMTITNHLPTRIFLAGFSFKVYCGSCTKKCYRCGSETHEQQACGSFEAKKCPAVVCGRLSRSLNDLECAADEEDTQVFETKSDGGGKFFNKEMDLEVARTEFEPDKEANTCGKTDSEKPKTKKKKKNRRPWTESQKELELKYCSDSKRLGGEAREAFLKARKDPIFRKEFLRFMKLEDGDEKWMETIASVLLDPDYLTLLDKMNAKKFTIDT